ncbi:MAG TPA: N-acetyl-alpha-D-glucosaminyl L-malate synthase BshA [Clostridiales bacterium UBA8153]|nr:N-acetyl-alpha-D-glucosaminyl L-malate synthase BshA [Clostridiales bacterium UBA8153]
MRVGIVCYPSYGGSGVVATELGKQLAVRGHCVHFISYEQPFRLQGYEENILFYGVEVPSYPLFKYPPYLLALTNKIIEVARHRRLDLIHAHYAIPHATAAYLARQVLGSSIKTVTTLHGTDITLVGQEPSFGELVAFSIDQSDGVTAVSRSLAEDTNKHFQLRRPIRTIYNFVDTEEFKPRLDHCLRQRFAGPEEKILVHMSNFRPVKRIPDVIDIFRRVNERLPSRLLLIGDGPESVAARQQVQAYGLETRVFFLGQQDRVAQLLAAGDLFLLPSDRESFGLAALEAMACGVPVVASLTGGVPEVVPDGECGFLLPVGDVEGMAAGALAILQDTGTACRMALASRRRAVEEFNAEGRVAEYEAFYREVLSAPP